MTELLFRDDAYLKTATARVVAVRDGKVELDRTIFYPLGGGQPGDTGFLTRGNGDRVAIADTRKGETPGSVAHVIATGSALPEVGEAVSLEIDWERRYALMRLHTALHADRAPAISRLGWRRATRLSDHFVAGGDRRISKRAQTAKGCR